MPRVIDSDALDVLPKSLGLAGTGAPSVELIDGAVDQVLDVGPIVRRGRTVAQTQGIFRAVFQNAHAAADNRSSVWTPYVTIEAERIEPFPTPVPEVFDLWLLGATVNRAAGTGTATAALSIQNVRQGMGVDSTPAAVTSNIRNIMAFWNQTETVNTTFLTAPDGQPWQKLHIRIPRVSESGSNVQIFFTSLSSALATWECNVYFGMFPVALGQDGVV